MTSEGGPEAHLVIWGTDVNVQSANRKFKDFLENFVDDLGAGQGEEEEEGSDPTTPYYLTRLAQVCEGQSTPQGSQKS